MFYKKILIAGLFLLTLSSPYNARAEFSPVESLEKLFSKSDLQKNREGTVLFQNADTVVVNDKLPVQASKQDNQGVISTWPVSDAYRELGNFDHLFQGQYKIVRKVRISPFFNLFRGFRDMFRPLVTFTQPIVFDDKVGLVDSHGVLYLLDENRKYKKIWRQDIRILIKPDAPSLSSVNLTYGQSEIFASTSNGYIICFSADNGEVKWQKKFDSTFRSAFKYDQGFLYGKSSLDQVFSIDAESGDLVWQKKNDDVTKVTLDQPSPVVTDSAILVAHQSGNLASYSKYGGELRWMIDIGTASNRTLFSMTDISVSPAIVGDNVIAGGINGGFYSINMESGQVNWEHNLGVIDGFASSYGFLFFIDNSDRMLAIHLSSGGFKWIKQLNSITKTTVARYINDGKRYNMQQNKYCAPLVVDKRLLLVDNRGNMHILSFDSGETQATVDVPIGVNGVSVAKQKIYLLSQIDNVLAIMQ